MISAEEFARSEAFQRAPVAYSLIDLEGRQVAANEAFNELFATATLPVDVESITHPDDRERTASYLTALRDGRRQQVVVDKRYVRPDGSVFWGRLIATAARDDEGLPAYFIGVIADLTEQMESLAQMQDASDAKSQIVARVSHDLRTPLHAIHGLAELLGYADLDEEHRAFAVAIQHEAESLRLLVDDLLDLSRLEAGRIDLRSEHFDLGAVIDDVVALVGMRARANGVDVTTDVDLGGAEVTGDPGRLRQILTNLADNAVKFTHDGSVTIRVRTIGDAVRFDVIDTGAGIEPADLDLIFEPFGRAHTDTSGTGLGLNISRDLIEMMGGSLGVVSEPGVGSTFTVTLPLTAVAGDDRTASGDEVALTTDAGHTAPSVLVVEDSEVNQMLASGQLARLGCECRIAPTGMDALRALEAEPFDLVLMDWHLPDIDGLETTRRWRMREAATRTTRTPIVAVTARAMIGDEERCIEAGMDGFVAKPVGLDDLALVLREHIRPPQADPDRAADTPAERLLDDLRRDLDDDELVATLVETFLGELDRRREALRAAAAASDHEGVRRVAHTLKSTSATVGAHALTELMRNVEQSAAAGAAEFPELDTPLDDIVEATRRDLTAAVHHLATTPGSTP